MSHHYLSPQELQQMEDRRQRDEALDKEIARRNSQLIGDIKSYKGVRYMATQDALFMCLELAKDSPLDGKYTRESTLKKIIDDLERLGQLPKSK